MHVCVLIVTCYFRCFSFVSLSKDMKSLDISKQKSTTFRRTGGVFSVEILE